MCSVSRLQNWLHNSGVVSKVRLTLAGRTLGGNPKVRGALFHMLRNQTYRGMINHRDKVYPGLHAAIVEQQLFNEVQDMLDANSRRRRRKNNRVARAPLIGRLFDGLGNALTPSFTHNNSGKVYRYYVAAPLHRGDRTVGERLTRIPATAIERLVDRQVARLVPTYDKWPLSLPTRIEIHSEAVQLMLPIEYLSTVRQRLSALENVGIDPLDPNSLRLSIPMRMQNRGGKRVIKSSGPQDSDPDAVLIKALRASHLMLQKDGRGMPWLEVSPKSPYERRMIMLAFLAPDIQKAVLDGRQLPGLMLERLIHGGVPACWEEQRQNFVN